MKGTKPEKDDSAATVEALKAKNAELASRLDEAEETIHAIQQGAVDAFVLEELGRRRVYSLEGAERPYRLFVEEMQQGVATLHKDGTIAYGNRRLAQLLQVPHDELIGANLRDFIAPDDRGIADELLAEGQSGTLAGEARLLRGDGSSLAAHLTLNTLPNEPDALMGLFVTDVTVQKNHDQLARAQDALRDADRRKNEFLAMLAHELRNPLAPIRNAVNILRLTSGDMPSSCTAFLIGASGFRNSWASVARNSFLRRSASMRSAVIRESACSVTPPRTRWAGTFPSSFRQTG